MNLTVVLVSATVGLLLLVYYGVRTWGWRRTAVFFVSSLLLMALKERGSALYEHEYVVRDSLLKIGGVAPLIPIGWTFAFAVSWMLAEGVVERIRGRADLLFPTVALASVGVISVSVAMETTGVAMGWWTWSINNPSPHHFWESLLRSPAWGYHGIMMFTAIWIAESQPAARLKVFRFALIPFIFFQMTAPHNYFASILPPNADRFQGAWTITAFPFLVGVLAFFDWPKLTAVPRSQAPTWVTWLPYLAVSIMLIVCLVAHVFFLRDPALSRSLVPTAIFVLIAAVARFAPRRVP